MEIASNWLTIDDNELKLQLSPDILMQVEADIAEVANHDRKAIIYKLDSEQLLPVFASGLGISTSCAAKGAIVVWTYYGELFGKEPIMRTLLTLDGDLSQKVSQKALQYPISERIFSVHSFLVGQISQQIVTVITEYIYLQLQPYILGFSIYVTTRLYLCDPVRVVVNGLANSSILPNGLQIAINRLTDCNTLAIALTLFALAIWWLVIKSPLAIFMKSLKKRQGSRSKFSLSLVKSFIHSLNQLSIRLFNKSLRQLGTKILDLLNSLGGQIAAIAVVFVLIICWFLLWQGAALIPQYQDLIRKIASTLEPYLPFAIVGLREKIMSIMSILGNICFGNPLFSKVFIKLFFGRFVTVR
jgi:hypothetical protein